MSSLPSTRQYSVAFSVKCSRLAGYRPSVTIGVVTLRLVEREHPRVAVEHRILARVVESVLVVVARGVARAPHLREHARGDSPPSRQVESTGGPALADGRPALRVRAPRLQGRHHDWRGLIHAGAAAPTILYPGDAIDLKMPSSPLINPSIDGGMLPSFRHARATAPYRYA